MWTPPGSKPKLEITALAGLLLILVDKFGLPLLGMKPNFYGAATAWAIITSLAVHIAWEWPWETHRFFNRWVRSIGVMSFICVFIWTPLTELRTQKTQRQEPVAMKPAVPAPAAAIVRRPSDRQVLMELATDIFGFLRVQEKTCPRWNNQECRQRVGALFQTMFSKRVSKAIEVIESHGLINLHDMDNTCGTSDAPDWIQNCAERIRTHAHDLPQ